MKNLKGLTVALVVGLVAMASNSWAALSADAQSIFTAVDTAGLSTAITTVLVAFIGISMVFLAFKYGKKAINRG